MGYTLDQLLDETGVTKLAGRSNTKAAPEAPAFSKLAARCRKAAEVTSEEKTASDRNGLAEKTAQVEIIRHTMAEIDAILGDAPVQTKTAAPKQHPLQVEEFIKAALDAGHSAEAIATFLQKEGGLLSSISGRVHELRAGHAVERARGLARKAEGAGDKAFRMWEDRVRKAGDLGSKERDAVVSRMRVALGDENAAKLVHGHPAFKDLPSAKGLKRPAAEGGHAPAQKGHAVGVTIGGAKVGVTPEQLGKLKAPAAALGAGYLGHKALTSSSNGDNKKKGVVVINS